MFWLYCHMDIIIKMYLPMSDISSVQWFSRVLLSATLWTAACQPSLAISNSQILLKLMSIASGMPSNRLILCHHLLLPPSIFPSIRVFSNESVLCTRRSKYWSFSFSISPSNEYSGLISGILFSLFQQHTLLKFNFLPHLLQSRMYGLSP